MDYSKFDELHADLVKDRAPHIERIFAGYRAVELVAGVQSDGEAGIAHPLGPPTLSGSKITVEMMLNSPTRITRMVMDLTLQRFIADRIFSNAGGVSGGAVIYDQATENELYLDRDVQRIAPAGDYPLVTAPALQPRVAEVEKWGGKFFQTDEARDRNDSTGFMRKVRQLSNTIVRKINQRAIAELEASIAESGQVAVGRNWSTVVVGGSSQTNANLWPARDFALANQMAETDELGVTYNLWLLNPADYTNLVITYGAQNLPALLDTLNIRIYTSNRVTAGTAYAVAEGQVGDMKVERPLATETVRDTKDGGNDRTWVKSGVRPVMYVTDPFSVLKFTGLQG